MMGQRGPPRPGYFSTIWGDVFDVTVSFPHSPTHTHTHTHTFILCYHTAEHPLGLLGYAVSIALLQQQQYE
jgi:hypothetical protein